MGLRHVSWVQISDVTTVIAETHVIVVHNRNTTRTSTIHNADVDRAMYSTPKTNQAGTAIALISEKFGDGASSLSNRTM